MDRRGFMAAAGAGLAEIYRARRARIPGKPVDRSRTHIQDMLGLIKYEQLDNVYCKRINPEDTFRAFAERARREHWTYHEIDSSHSPHITAPDALQALLLAAA